MPVKLFVAEIFGAEIFDDRCKDKEGEGDWYTRLAAQGLAETSCWDSNDLEDVWASQQEVADERLLM